MIYVIKPANGEKNNCRMNRVLFDSLKKSRVEYKIIDTLEDFREIKTTNQKILFVLDLGNSGINIEYTKILRYIRNNVNLFIESVGGIIVDCQAELYTKSTARELIYAANMSGCEFLGRPMVEGTGTLKNFNLQAKLNGETLLEAYENSCLDLILRLKKYDRVTNKTLKNRKLLALHSSNFKTSNTLLLWNMIRENLTDFKIDEIGLNNGTITDCRGCSHKACMHFSEKNSCFYGGQIVEEVYPAVLNCDGLVMICPNYNDAVGANITAFINRLTSLYKTHKFDEKKLFAVIVSGYSGGDIICEQLVSAININKAFTLPPFFSICETANDVKEIYQCEDIVEKSRNFAEKIRKAFN